MAAMEARLARLEAAFVDTPFEHLVIRRTFPLHELAGMEEGILINILSRLARREMAKCLAVCSYWDRLRHRVAIARSMRPPTPDVVYQEGEGGDSWRALGHQRAVVGTLTNGPGIMQRSLRNGPYQRDTWVTSYQRSPGSGQAGGQWSGWRMALPLGSWMRLSCWIAFSCDGRRKPARTGNFGLKLHGMVHNQWLDSIGDNSSEWHYISAVGQATGGDGNHILLIFDSMTSPDAQPLEVLFTGLTLEVFRTSASPPLLSQPPIA